MTWEVRITETAKAMLAAISDRRIRRALVERIEGLVHDPDKQGKPLTGELAGLRSLRAAGQRYRMLYRLERGEVMVLVLAVGLRKEGSKKDVYELARKLLRLRLIDRR